MATDEKSVLKQEVHKALSSLYLELPESIANDVQQKVLRYTNLLEQELKDAIEEDDYDEEYVDPDEGLERRLVRNDIVKSNETGFEFNLGVYDLFKDGTYVKTAYVLTSKV